ncbi:hypothetical protein SAMN05428969_2838 [Devosia sp. YR412]|nr:hypothetical protein SAMN05428969_2838 [Devosia sp. YR412]
MPRPRTPIAKARATGAILNHPARYKGGSNTAGTAEPLGPPPNWLTPDQGAAWDDLASTLPWLNRSHSGIVGITANLMAQLQSGAASVTAMNLLRLCLGQLGATPADAQRVEMPSVEEEGDSLADKYFS